MEGRDGCEQPGDQQSALAAAGGWDLEIINYISKALTAAEKNYDVYDKEFLGVIWALHEWQAYLIGVDETIEIWMDHANLQYF